MNVIEAAKEASLGDNNPLWDACWKIAKERGWTVDPKIQNQEMCEMAIKAMTNEQRRYFNIVL